MSNKSHQNKSYVLSQRREGNGVLYTAIFSYVKATGLQTTILESMLIVRNTIYFPKFSDPPSIDIYVPKPKKMNKSIKDLSVLLDVKVMPII